jgi:hypothetical protein
MRPEGLGNLIKIIHLIGSRTRDLQVCNIAVQEDESLKEIEEPRLRLRSEELSAMYSSVPSCYVALNPLIGTLSRRFCQGYSGDFKD